jgi:hypothetical protein
LATRKTLPGKVATQDKRLQAEAKSAGEKLGQLRWHWTLDETNPERVTFRAYARSVGVHHKRIMTDAKAWEVGGG